MTLTKPESMGSKYAHKKFSPPVDMKLLYSMKLYEIVWKMYLQKNVLKCMQNVYNLLHTYWINKIVYISHAFREWFWMQKILYLKWTFEFFFCKIRNLKSVQDVRLI